MKTFTNTAKGLALYVVLFFALWTIRATILIPIDKSFSSPALAQIFADTVRVLIWIVPVFVYLTWADNSNPVEYLRLNSFGNKKAVIRSSIIVFFYFAIILLVDLARAGHPFKVTFSSLLLSNSWLKTILMITVAPIAEEILFRGFLLQKFQTFLGKWQANLVTSFLFVAIHYPHWIYTEKAPLEILTLSLSIFILSILLGYLMQKTETLLPSIIVHMLNNLISFYVHVG